MPSKTDDKDRFGNLTQSKIILSVTDQFKFMLAGSTLPKMYICGLFTQRIITRATQDDLQQYDVQQDDQQDGDWFNHKKIYFTQWRACSLLKQF